MKQAGHRRMERLCQELRMLLLDVRVTELINQYLHYVDSTAGEMVPRPSEETVMALGQGGFCTSIISMSVTVNVLMLMD